MDAKQHPERLDGLIAFLQPSVEELIERVSREQHLTLMVVHGWRGVREQWELYSRGRTMNRETGEWEVLDPGMVVTNARPGLSAHNVITIDGEPAAMGVDLIPITSSGQPLWETPEPVWRKIYDVAWKVGLDPLGDTIGAYLRGDWGHFEEPGWKLKLAGLRCIQPVSEVVRT